jgi:hypothetical protein
MEMFPCLANVSEQVGLAVVDPRSFLLETPSSDIHKKILIVQSRMEYMSRLLNSVLDYEDSVSDGPFAGDELSCLSEIADRCSIDIDDQDFDNLRPYKNVGAGEKVIGELSDDLKKLFLAIGYLTVDIEDMENEKDQLDQTASIEKKRRLKKVMEDVFWYEITDDFNLWQHKDTVVGLRTDWKIVVFGDRRRLREGFSQERRGSLTRQSTGIIFGIVFKGRPPFN